MGITKIFSNLTIKAESIARFGTALIATVIVAALGAVEFTFGFFNQ